MVNQLVSPQLFTACEEGRVEDVVQLLFSGVSANVTDEGDGDNMGMKQEKYKVMVLALYL